MKTKVILGIAIVSTTVLVLPAWAFGSLTSDEATVCVIYSFAASAFTSLIIDILSRLQARKPERIVRYD
jgi:hypothetical protein